MDHALCTGALYAIALTFPFTGTKKPKSLSSMTDVLDNCVLPAFSALCLRNVHVWPCSVYCLWYKFCFCVLKKKLVVIVNNPSCCIQYYLLLSCLYHWWCWKITPNAQNVGGFTWMSLHASIVWAKKKSDPALIIHTSLFVYLCIKTISGVVLTIVFIVTSTKEHMKLCKGSVSNAN